jgi:hypothetical protein
VVSLNLRERFEVQNGKVSDELFDHVLKLALDDQEQYVKLSASEISAVLDPLQYPPNRPDTQRLDDIRERLLEAMEIILGVVRRRNLCQ